jgi:Holliday junction resolvase RusA-like endonuclease
MAVVEREDPPVFGDPLIDLFVYGRPARQGSNAFLGKGRVRPDDDTLYFWRDRVATAVVKHWGRRPSLPASVAVVVAVTFYVPKPASYASYKLYPITDRDVDKFLRACLDALAPTSDSHPGAGIISNDNRVIAAVATKLYAPDETEAGMHLRLWQVPTEYERQRWVPAFEPSFIPYTAP